jgi:hypothetical protein
VTFLLVEEMSAAARHRRRHSFVKLGTGGDFFETGAVEHRGPSTRERSVHLLHLAIRS